MLPLGPIGQFDSESRQALYRAAIEASEKQNPEALTVCIAAALIRCDSVRRLLDNVDPILRELGAAEDMYGPADLLTFWNELEQNLVDAPEQSVTAPQFLLMLLEFSPDLRAKFAKHGFDLDEYRRKV